MLSRASHRESTAKLQDFLQSENSLQGLTAHAERRWALLATACAFKALPRACDVWALEGRERENLGSLGEASKGLHRRRGWPISARSQSFCLAHVEFLPRSLLLAMLLCCKVCNLHMATRYCTMALQSCENCARGSFLISGIKRSNALACHSLHIAGRWMY
jgi:hypothetical protein